MKNKIYSILLSVIFTLLFFAGCSTNGNIENNTSNADISSQQSSIENIEQSNSLSQDLKFGVKDIPAYTDKAYITINNNKPYFTADEITSKSFETYSELDNLGRCGVAFSCVGKDLMPTEERGSIGQIKPSGWVMAKYDFVDGKYLYNRCHLIGYQLTAENANEKNLITGTRYLNIQGMLSFENKIADYVKTTGNHVMYRVTPIFEGDNLVASGLLMEGYSVEDKGEGINFCVYAYNVQPGVEIDYATGESKAIVDNSQNNEEKTLNSEGTTYIINKNNKKFHFPECSSVDSMKPQNKKEYVGNRDELINNGHEPCDRCKP